MKINSQPDRNPFALIAKPSSGPSRAVGEYAKGCLFGAMPMPKSGAGFEMIRLSRNRYYGHPALISLLLRAGEALQGNSKMLYGDLAQPRGGPMPGGHASHQSGLDADIWFYDFPAARKIRATQRESLVAESVLTSNHREVDAKKWHPVYTEQLMWFAAQPETDRIFVNAAIKQRLCKQFPGDPRLARLRPWYFHDDHFHLRLKCPPGETSCVPQKPINEPECEDKDLAFWFTDEVLAKFDTAPDEKPFDTELPLECKTLLP